MCAAGEIDIGKETGLGLLLGHTNITFMGATITALVSSEVYMKRQYSACQTASMNEWIRSDEFPTFT